MYRWEAIAVDGQVTEGKADLQYVAVQKAKRAAEQMAARGAGPVRWVVFWKYRASPRWYQVSGGVVQ